MIRRHPWQITYWLFGAFFFLLATLRIGFIVWGGETITFDGEAWRRFGSHVLDGATPYSDVTDNKPPLWLGIATVAVWLDAFAPMMLYVVAGANAIIVYLLGTTLDDQYGSLAGVVGAATVLLLLSRFGFYINNKSLAVALALLATRTDRPAISGLLIGAGFGIAQYVGAVLPVLVAVRWIEGTWGRREALVTTGSTAGAIVGPYLLLLLVWGPQTSADAIKQTVFVIGPYVQSTSQFPDRGLVTNLPGLVLARFIERAASLWYVLIPAFLGAVAITANRVRPGWLWLAWTVVFFPWLLLTTFGHYWVMVTPGLAGLVGAAAVLYSESDP
jgi:hypothetical protein